MRRALSKPKHLLVIALGLHVTVTSVIFLAGKQTFWPDAIDQNGIARFLDWDSLESYTEVVSHANLLSNGGVVPFARASFPLHFKLYAVSFAIFSPLFGYTILSVEPLNAFFYLVILCLIFNLSRLICSREACFIATGAVALWVSFLLHTTQLLRDPLFIAVMLTFVFITASWLTTVFTWRAALIRALVGVASIALLWEVRITMRDIMTAIAILGGTLLLAKQIREKRFLRANTLGAVIMIAACFVVPKVVTPYRAPVNLLDSSESPSTEAPMKKDSKGSIASKVSLLRDGFVTGYPAAGSNIDLDVRFESTTDIVRYAPRALVIGLFAPFPQMWFSEAKTTAASGRILSGVETFVMYVFELLAVFGIWKLRRQWATWLLLSVALMGALALGLVVPNVGALYRMRYAFWMLLIILGAEGAIQFHAWWAARRKRAVEMSA